MSFASSVLRSMLASIVGKFIYQAIYRVAKNDLALAANNETERMMPGVPHGITYTAEYNAEDGTPAQDVVLLGDCPYVLVRFAEEGTTSVQAGGLTQEDEGWYLADVAESVQAVAAQREMFAETLVEVEEEQYMPDDEEGEY